MNNEETNCLANIVLAPFIQKATALIGVNRKVGGNQFRHAMATLAILIDYHYTDPVLLKASVIHDLFEDVDNINPEDIINIDQDGQQVFNLVMEVTNRENSKTEYLKRILENSTEKAKILKCADRISNLTDLHIDIFDREYIIKYLEETEIHILPIAELVNQNMLFELKDLIKRRRALLKL